MRIDLVTTGSRAQAQHDAACPDIGPICETRAEPPQQHHTTLWINELRLLTEYGFTDRLALQLGIPLRTIHTETNYTDLEGNSIELDYSNIHHRNETIVGLGDLQLLTHFGQSLGDWAFGTRIGMTVPTGKVHENPYRLGEQGEPHQHIQFGTGTFDPFLSLDVGRKFGQWSLSSFGQLQVPLYEGRHGYQAGARMLGGLAISRTFSKLSARLLFTAAHERAERWDGNVPTEDGNLGRTDLFVGPGITLPFAKDYSASIDVGVRVYGKAEGAQLDMPIVISLSVGKLFHLEKGQHIEALPTGAADTDVKDHIVNGEAKPLTPVAGKWTIFDFWASWCEACLTLDTSLRKLLSERTDIALRRVNIVDFDSAISQAELQGVTSLPHVRLVDPQGRTSWEASDTPANLMREIRSRVKAPQGISTISIVVTKRGFEPSTINIRRGQTVHLIVTRQTEETCATDFLIRDLGVSKTLPLRKPVDILVVSPRSGEFTFGCSMDMITGKLRVK